MSIDTAIFDMDGLLIDSEPLWHEAAQESLQGLGITIDDDMYASTVGLRTRECLAHWFAHYQIDQLLIPATDADITERVILKVEKSGRLMDGVMEALDLMDQLGYKMGLATSSPMSMIRKVLSKSNLEGRFHAISSAEHLPFGKPHPQVYLDCANALKSIPSSCICFEDSFNGMIAAKAARMKCIVVPSPAAAHKSVWGAADLSLASLEDLTKETLLRI